MVVMSPVSVINNKPARRKRKVTYRTFNDVSLQLMQEWMNNEDWSRISHEN